MQLKSALVHDWLVSSVGGSENALREIYDLYPSPIYSLLWDPRPFEGTRLAQAEVFTSFIKRLPFASKIFRTYLPLFPLAIEQFDLRSYDVILSSSHCIAKGVLTSPDQLHICYCYTPMRYAWDLTHEYLQESGLDKGLKSAFTRLFLHYLRGWDVHSSHRVDHFIAISHFVARRIRRAYGRKADVIYPPVNTDFFQLCEKKDHFYLAASRLVSYKKIDLIVEAFSEMPDRKLVVVGDGPDMDKIKAKAKKNVEIMGHQPDPILKGMYQKARAFVFAAVEDFGIVPIEAMASGTPVIALNRGGAAETVEEGVSGHLFCEQTVAGIKQAVEEFEKMDAFVPSRIRQEALKFGIERFRSEYRQYVDEKVSSFNERRK